MTRALLLPLACCIASAGCGGKAQGPGLPNCTRPPTAVGCTATWTGAVSGSTSCDQTTWDNTGAWNLVLTGGGLTVGLSLPSVPTPEENLTLSQIIAMNQDGNPLIQLDAASGWWGATRGIGGDFLLHVDEVAPGSFYAHGTIAGSLVNGSSGHDSGVQICIIF